MTLLYFRWNSLWFCWKFHLHLERNCHLFFLRFLPDHSYFLVISLAQFPRNFLPHKPPSSWKTWNAYEWFPPLFCACVKTGIRQFPISLLPCCFPEYSLVWVKTITGNINFIILTSQYFPILLFFLPAAFPGISQLLGKGNNYFPNSELSWYSISSSQNVPISVKLSSVKFYNKFPRMGKKNFCFFRYFPTFGKWKKYFPNLRFSWYCMTSSQNVPISVKLSSLWYPKNSQGWGKNPLISQKLGLIPNFIPKWENRFFFPVW